MSTWCRFLTLVAAVLHLSEPACAAPGASPACSIVWNGQAVSGKLDGGICKTTVRYGAAARWEDAVAVTSQSGISATENPPSCPQIMGNPTQGATSSEDCLTATIYAPVGGRRLPLFCWLHGGSYSIGSASAAGLDGANLAKRGRVIVVVLQYRLNVLGLIPPSVAPTASDPNLQVRDIILGLKEVRKNLAWQGDMDQVTIGGQSTGASLIRALWVAPAAQGLFQRMILQSDPFNYGMAPMSETNNFRSAIYNHPALGSANTFAALQAAPLANVLGAAGAVYNAAANQMPSSPPSQPFRPTYGTPTIPKEPTGELFNNPGGLTFSPASVPMLLTTVADDGAHVFTNSEMNFLAFRNILARLVGPAGLQVILTTPTYNITADNTDKRPAFTKILTDGAWRCAAREVARKWAGAGGQVYVGEFREGIHYPLNDQYPYCAGKVCHMDDIMPTFGQGGGFANMIADNWLSFIKTGRPAGGWSAFAASNGIDGAGVKALGGDGVVPTCPAGFWGSAVKWHWQLFA
ncbi:alpha/beta-hydrolase [Cutaneotrichosporon oleaginosum]|uniref:Alpha/beta-hydrolase n=1 Tax=Cutaneotrichosporon oleaginosum TaxID=879819 RepID=A0A0J0XJI5_9TREE|nr:alpha/beta-hydrolase [Cutaneotrichosporon oleaginosum]KLT41211.1 alpha/beta-hydrolase [Cutaneotrichosporon oleaginosum]TXT05477.1 hypothetical protein COLE_06797 [Cutaneotrichosporon oleaginosum]